MEDPMFAKQSPATRRESSTAAGRDGASADVASGAANHRQSRIVSLLTVAAHRGMTVNELKAHDIGHHGMVSGALSTMHREAIISCLKARRNGAHVYVLPQFVLGRIVRPFLSQRKELTDAERDRVNTLRSLLAAESDKPIFVPRATVKGILAIIERLEK